jgi:photosystem II stability/assembly factor-like uncharacterized protein
VVRSSSRFVVRLALLAVLPLIAFATLNSGQSVPSGAKSQRFGFPDEFAKQFHAMTVPEGKDRSGYTVGYRHSALRTLKALRKRSGDLLPWVERGPGNVGGRTRGLVIDRNDPSGNTILAGSVGGGIWRSTDAGQSWEAMTDDAPRLSITSIAQSPSEPDVLYAGTGEGFPNADAAIGDGILKSTDGGLTWEMLTSTTGGTDFLFVNRVIVSETDENVIVAAVNTGIWRSTDGGASWNRQQEPDSFNGFYQVISEPGNFSIQYAIEDRSGVWKSTDGGITWQGSNTGLAEAGSGARIELDVSALEPSRIFALVEKGDGVDPTYVSVDRGETWSLMVAQGGSDDSDIAGTQGWYDLMVHAHPTIADHAFMGGIALYRLRQTGGSSARNVFGGVDEEGTESFLDFVNFGASHLGGGLRLGLEEDVPTITEDKMVSVEVRYGPDRSQNAHRFVPPDQSGVDFLDYPYADYVDVPFEVWDITNNIQLGVSFRDREDNGVYDLSEFNSEDVDREYVMISARPYTGDTPDPLIARDGGVRADLAYFFWPVLAAGGTWNPEDLPESVLRMNWINQVVGERVVQQIGTGVHVDQHVMRSFITGSGENDFRVVLGNDGGIFVSNDGGQNWNERFRGYNTTQFYGVDKKPGRTVYLGGTQDNGSWRSLGNPNRGSFWFGAGGGDGFDALWHKQNDQKLLTTSQWTSIRRSTNGGIGFEDATAGLLNSGDGNGSQFFTVLSARTDDSDIVYTVGRDGVWRSDDFAASWELRAIPSEQWGYSGSSGKVHVSHADGDIVWAGYEMDPTASGGDDAGHLHRSLDDGRTFEAIPTPSWAPGRLSGLNSSFDNPNLVYVTFSFAGRPKVIRSTDAGLTWEDLSGFRVGSTDVVSDNGFPDVSVYDILDFPDTNILWAATEIGIVESRDNGATWELADNGLPSVSVWQIKMLDDEVVVATHGRGIWTLPIAAVATDTDTEVALPETLQLEAAYPNPFVDRVHLSWSLPQTGPVTIDAFDVQGRRVAKLYQGVQAVGRHALTWDGAHLTAGAYWIRITTRSGSQTRSVVKSH